MLAPMVAEDPGQLTVLMNGLTVAQLERIMPASLRATCVAGELKAALVTKICANIIADPAMVRMVAAVRLLQAALVAPAPAPAAAAAPLDMEQTMAALLTAHQSSRADAKGLVDAFSLGAVALAGPRGQGCAATHTVEELTRAGAVLPGTSMVASGLNVAGAINNMTRKIILAAVGAAARTSINLPGQHATADELRASAASLGFTISAEEGAAARLVTFKPPGTRVALPHDALASFRTHMLRMAESTVAGAMTLPATLRAPGLALMRRVATAPSALAEYSTECMATEDPIIPLLTFATSALVHGVLLLPVPGDPSLRASLTLSTDSCAKVLESAVLTAASAAAAAASAAMAAMTARAGGGHQQQQQQQQQQAKRPAAAAPEGGGGGAPPPIAKKGKLEGKMQGGATMPHCFAGPAFRIVLQTECPIHKKHPFMPKEHTCASKGYLRASCHQLPRSMGGAGSEEAWKTHRVALYLDKHKMIMPACGQSPAAANPQSESLARARAPPLLAPIAPCPPPAHNHAPAVAARAIWQWRGTSITAGPSESGVSRPARPRCSCHTTVAVAGSQHHSWPQCIWRVPLQSRPPRSCQIALVSGGGPAPIAGPVNLACPYLLATAQRKSKNAAIFLASLPSQPLPSHLP
jgi:hypothetical protein